MHIHVIFILGWVFQRLPMHRGLDLHKLRVHEKEHLWYLEIHAMQSVPRNLHDGAQVRNLF